MTANDSEEPRIIRTGWGLTIAGTRITLYDVMDYWQAGYPAQLIREKLCLTDAQVNAALSYINDHREEVDAEYQEVLRITEENRQYWNQRNQEHLSRLSVTLDQGDQDSLRAKLQDWKERLASRV